MKNIIYLIGLGLFLMVGAVGCESDEHEHNERGGTYNGYYQGYGHEYHNYPDYNYDNYHH